MSPRDLKVLFVDTQTTGMRPPQGQVIELAWAFGEEDIQSELVALSEGHSLPFRVSQITGITEADLAGGLELERVFERFHEAAKLADVVVAHYAQFEKPFLADLYARFAPEAVMLPMHCTYRLAQKLFPKLPSRNIRATAGFFGDQVEETNRAGAHVAATRQIWNGLVAKLEEVGVTDLEAYVAEKPKKKAKPSYEYRIGKELRLKLPDEPGVYRMLAKSGEVLYVGKATSLKSRVNSYFRGVTGRDKRKLEMLAQVWDLNVTSCKTALEAALLEADEIKKFNPPYNVVMKRGRRHLVFYSRDFSSASLTEDADHRVGPFRGMNSIEHVRELVAGRPERAFYEELDPALLKEGWQLFITRFGITRAETVREILCCGLKLFRHGGAPESSDNEDYTAEDIAGKFARLFERAGLEYVRSRKLTRLLNADVELKLKDETRRLAFRRGRIDGERDASTPYPWEGLDVDTYDRMSVLLSELEKYEHHVHPLPEAR